MSRRRGIAAAAAVVVLGLAGALVVIVTGKPGVTEAVEKTKGRRLLDSSQVVGLSPSGFVFKREFIARRPQDVEAFARVWPRTTTTSWTSPRSRRGRST